MCRVQEPWLSVKGQGHTSRSKVKFCPLVCRPYSVSALYLPHLSSYFKITWHKSSTPRHDVSRARTMTVGQRSRSHFKVKGQISTLLFVSGLYLPHLSSDFKIPWHKSSTPHDDVSRAKTMNVSQRPRSHFKVKGQISTLLFVSGLYLFHLSSDFRSVQLK